MTDEPAPAAAPSPKLPPQPKRERAPWREIEALWLTGESRDELARRFGIPRCTIARHITKHKLEQRRAEYTEALRREIVDRIAGPIADRVVRQIEDLLSDAQNVRKESIAAMRAQASAAAPDIPIEESEVRAAGAQGSVRTKRSPLRLRGHDLVQLFKVEADLLIRFGKGIRLLEPEVLSVAGADAAQFVRDAIEAGKAIDATCVPAAELAALAEDASDPADSGDAE